MIAGLALSGALSLLGVVLIDRGITTRWSGSCVEIWSTTILGRELMVSQPLLQVAAGLSALAALYFVVVSLRGAEVRASFFDEETAALHSAVAAWVVYRRVAMAVGAARAGGLTK